MSGAAAASPATAGDGATSGELRGVCAVVTGAASGIGRAIAVELAAAGAALLLHTRARADALEETAGLCRARGGEATALLADFGIESQRESFVKSALARVEQVDIWVNNAGADVLTGAGAELAFAEKLDLLWRVDVLGTITLSRAIGRRMVSQGSGVILNMGWDQARTGMEGESGELFGAAKGAVMAFSRSLARSLAPRVRVNCLAPGWIRTSWGASASPEWQERVERETPLGRWGTPEDVARAARFLASPAASYVTGQVFCVNGGAVS